MKAYIGNHPPYFGPYQFAGLLKFVGVPEKTAYNLGGKLQGTWVEKILEWMQPKRRVWVSIDNHDTWSMDHTLALIILPMLKQLKATKHGAPNVDDEHVPEHLRSTSAGPKEDEYDVDEHHFKRWDWVLDEMIWAFTQKTLDNDTEQFFDHSGVDHSTELLEQVHAIKFDKLGLDAHEDRKQRAFELFGKYYQALWD